MKKILKFAFAIVAMACVVLASASCGKDDDGIIEGLDAVVSGDPVYHNGYGGVQLPELKESKGKVFDLSWEPIKGLADTAKIEYEVWMSADEKQTWIQFPKTSDTLFHFGKDYLSLFEIDNVYYFKIAGYYWFKGMRRVFSMTQYYHPYMTNYPDDSPNVYIMRQIYHNLEFRVGNKICLQNYDSLRVSFCDINAEKEVIKTYATWVYKTSDSNQDFKWWYDNDWSKISYFEYFGEEGTKILEYFYDWTGKIN